MRRVAKVAGLIVLAGLASQTAALARHRHHARVREQAPPRQFVFESPTSAETALFAGQFAGYMLPGIMGATTADPYERPGYGYYVGGGHGPGYLYDGQ